MKFHILDVGHGFCGCLVADNGNTMLFDCGHDAVRNYHPSDLLPSHGWTRIDRFFVTNYDEDHISDLPNLSARAKIT